LIAPITVKVWKSVISRVEPMLVYQAAKYRAGPLDLSEHLLRLSEEFATEYYWVNSYYVDLLALAIEGDSIGLEIAMRAVDIGTEVGSGDFSKNDVRLIAREDSQQFRQVGTPRLRRGLFQSAI
jgi:hypothetical protein